MFFSLGLCALLLGGCVVQSIHPLFNEKDYVAFPPERVALGDQRAHTIRRDRLHAVQAANVIGQLVKLNVQMMDKYLPGIRAIATTEISPLSAIEQIEGPSQIREIRA